MSELKACCPVCGREMECEYATSNESGMSIYAKCECGTIIPINHINDRVIQWVPVSERQPEDADIYFVLEPSIINPGEIIKNIARFDGKTWGRYWHPSAWLEDRTDKEDK